MSVLGRVLADIKNWLVSQHHPPPSGPGQSAHSLCSFLPALKGFPQSSARRQLGWPQRRGKQRQRKAETQRNQEKETTRRAERVKVKTELEREIDKETKKQRTECVYQRQPRRDSQTVRSHTHTYEHGGNRPRGKM